MDTTGTKSIMEFSRMNWGGLALMGKTLGLGILGGLLGLGIAVAFIYTADKMDTIDATLENQFTINENLEQLQAEHAIQAAALTLLLEDYIGQGDIAL